MVTAVANRKGIPVDYGVEKVDHLVTTSYDEKRQIAVPNTTVEHELTFKDVLRNHKRLVWWCFYFAMCAIGW